MNILVDICTLPVKRGNCWDVVPSFYFNSAAKKCERFMYSGCGGNDNKFHTKKACQAKCVSEKKPAGIWCLQIVTLDHVFHLFCSRLQRCSRLASSVFQHWQHELGRRQKGTVSYRFRDKNKAADLQMNFFRVDKSVKIKRMISID